MNIMGGVFIWDGQEQDFGNGNSWFQDGAPWSGNGRFYVRSTPNSYTFTLNYSDGNVALGCNTPPSTGQLNEYQPAFVSHRSAADPWNNQSWLRFIEEFSAPLIIDNYANPY